MVPTFWRPQEIISRGTILQVRMSWRRLGCLGGMFSLSSHISFLEDISKEAPWNETRCPCLCRLQWHCEASPAQWAWGCAPLCRSWHCEPPGSDWRQHLLRACHYHGPALGERCGCGRVPQETLNFQGEAGRRPVWGGELILWVGPPVLGRSKEVVE